VADRKATFAKRQRELDQKEQARQREQRRLERKARSEAANASRTTGDPDEDPDLAGIVPGPQPRPDDDHPNVELPEPTPGRSDDTT
jgi:hypothetical protein